MNAGDGPEDPLDAEAVRHVASLARVSLDAGEAERFATELADILVYFETLDQVPEIEAESDLTNVFRPDEVRDGLTQEEALRNAQAEEGYFRGPRVS